MQQDLQGTAWQEHQRERGERAAHPAATTPEPVDRAQQVRQACELVEKELELAIREGQPALIRCLWLLPGLLPLSASLLVAFLVIGFGPDPFQLPYPQAGWLLLLLLSILPPAAYAIYRRLEKLYYRDTLALPYPLLPAPLRVHNSMAQAALERCLNGSGIAEQLATAAMRDPEKVEELLVRLGHQFNLAEPGPGSSRRFTMNLSLASSVIGLLLLPISLTFRHVEPVLPMVALLFAGIGTALHFTEASRYIVGLKLAAPYLKSALRYYAASGSLQAERTRDAEIPPAVQVEQGSGRLGRMTIELAAELARRGSGLGWSVPIGTVAPLLFSIVFCGMMAVLNMFEVTTPGEVFTNGVSAILLFLLLRLLSWQVGRQALARMEQLERSIRRRGLVSQMAMGLLPIRELQLSCPPFLQRMLYLPTMPKQLRGTANEQAWLLMWNADWFCGERVPMVRPRWHSNWLLPLGLLPAILVLVGVPVYLVGILVGENPLPDNITLIGWYLAILLLTTCLIYLSMLGAARHLAGAWAVLSCMEQLVQEGEGDGS